MRHSIRMSTWYPCMAWIKSSLISWIRRDCRRISLKLLSNNMQGIIRRKPCFKKQRSSRNACRLILKKDSAIITLKTILVSPSWKSMSISRLRVALSWNRRIECQLWSSSFLQIKKSSFPLHFPWKDTRTSARNHMLSSDYGLFVFFVFLFEKKKKNGAKIRIYNVGEVHLLRKGRHKI